MSDKESLELRLQRIADDMVETLLVKDDAYGSSWKSKGGFSAFFNLDRKWSRVENLARQHGYDVFAAAKATEGSPDSMVESLRDLIGYAMLSLDEIAREAARRTGTPDSSAEPGAGYVDQDR
jgi:hypothetical protein